MFRRLREAVARFMVGRYGNDQLNRFLFGGYFVLWMLSVLCFGWVGLLFDLLCSVTAVWLLWRMLSRNYARRQAENERFLRWWGPIKRWFSFQFTRLPVKRGRRTVTCHRCRHQFKSFFL